jgi:zinc transport system permease protein
MLDILGQPFFQNALVAGVLVGATSSLLGVYVVLKRIVFLAIALAQTASAAVALALLVGWNPLVTAVTASVGGALLFSQVRWRAHIPMEAILATAYVLAAALGTVFIARNPVGEARALGALFGSILAVPAWELAVLAAVAAAIVAVHVRFRREFVFVSFDRDAAAAQGLRARGWELLLYLTLAVGIACAIRSAGVLVTFAALVVPAVAARSLTRGIGAMFWMAAALGTAAAPLGLTIAFALDVPTGAAIALTLTVLALAALAARSAPAWLRVAGAAVILLVAGVLPASAQDSPVERELRALRESVAELHRLVGEQQRLIDQLRTTAPAGRVIPAAAPPPSPAVTPAHARPPAPPPVTIAQPPAGAPVARPEPLPPADSPRLPPWISLLPEIRVEGNVIANFTFPKRRERELVAALGEEDEAFVRRNALNLREVELGLRSAIDPFARFEAILSAEQEASGDLEVGLEEGILSFGALPGGLELKLGKFRTGFGEFNDSDPEEFPAVDPPNVVSNIFGREGDGWIDTGLALTRRFGVTDTLSFVLWGAVFNGDNETAFHGGEVGWGRRPAWFGRFETFLELAEATGLEIGVGYAEGHALDARERPTLRSRIFNAHLELDHRDPLLGLYRGLNFLTEFFYTWRDTQVVDEATGDVLDEDVLGRWGLYSLAEAQIARQWSVSGRFDYSQLPTGGDDGSVPRETAGSLIVSFRPSRFLTLRAQYKHTERNFAPDSDELYLQALFVLGYERPGPF